MEDILWVILLIVISNVFGNKKKKAAKAQNEKAVAGSHGLEVAKVQPKKERNPKQQKGEGIGARGYFKSIVNEIKNQQNMAMKKMQEMRGANTAQQSKSVHTSAKALEVVDKVSREGEYYSQKAMEYNGKKKNFDEWHNEPKRSESGHSEQLSDLFESHDDVIRGIVYYEIFSKPKSLRKN